MHYLVAEEEIDRHTHYDDTLMLDMMNEASQNTCGITWVPLAEDPSTPDVHERMNCP